MKQNRSNLNDQKITFPSHIIHLLDSAEPDIRFVVQIEADVGRSEAESNINLDLHNNRMLGEALSNKCFIMLKSLNDYIENWVCFGQIFVCS